ncbi:MAG: hypothetical protein AAF622_17555, partial [Cyanobacteria bacterium P01_C01_bin.147]
MTNTFVRRFRRLFTSAKSPDQTLLGQPHTMANSSSAPQSRQIYPPANPTPETEPTPNKRPPYRRPLYYRPLFWLVLAVGAVSATGLTRAYRIWQATESELPPVTELETFERQGTITITSADNVILQKIGPAT